MKKKQSELVKCTYFTWRLRNREGVWYADGRGDNNNPGRHSLNTRDYEEAVEQLNRLDLARAVDLGLADPAALESSDEQQVSLKSGVELFLEHGGRDKVAGGIKEKSVNRYRAVFDKFVPFLERKGLKTWNQVKRHHLEAYSNWLTKEKYEFRTRGFELTQIKSAVNWLIRERYLPESAKIYLRVTKPRDSDTYCYRLEEIEAMLDLCRNDPKLSWLADVIVALANTGMRISELADLTWRNVDLESDQIVLRDESRRSSADPNSRQSTKSGRDRSLPILAKLKLVLLRRVANKKGPRVFTAPRGGKLRPDNVRWALLKKVIEPLADQFPSEPGKEGFKDGRLHSFRHFFCSLCIEDGVSIPFLMDWLGHRESDMVQYYTRIRPAASKQEVKKVRSVG